MGTGLLAGNGKMKHTLNVLLLLTMYVCASLSTATLTSAQETENSDAEELFYRGRGLQKVDIGRGFMNPATGEWINRPVNASVDSASKPVTKPNPPTGNGTQTATVPIPKPNHVPISDAQPVNVTQTSGAGLHCMIELLDPKGGAPAFKDLSISRDFKTGDIIQIYCRSNIDARLAIWQQQNGEETLLYPYDNIDNRLRAGQFASIQPQNHAMQFQKGEEGEFSLKFLIITDDRYNEIQSSPTGNPQQRLAAAYSEASRGWAPIVNCNEASRGLAPVVSCNTNGFFATAKDPVLALEIVLNQLP